MTFGDPLLTWLVILLTFAAVIAWGVIGWLNSRNDSLRHGTQAFPHPKAHGPRLRGERR